MAADRAGGPGARRHAPGPSRPAVRLRRPAVDGGRRRAGRAGQGAVRREEPRGLRGGPGRAHRPHRLADAVAAGRQQRAGAAAGRRRARGAARGAVRRHPRRRAPPGDPTAPRDDRETALAGRGAGRGRRPGRRWPSGPPIPAAEAFLGHLARGRLAPGGLVGAAGGALAGAPGGRRGPDAGGRARQRAGGARPPRRGPGRCGPDRPARARPPRRADGRGGARAALPRVPGASRGAPDASWSAPAPRRSRPSTTWVWSPSGTTATTCTPSPARRTPMRGRCCSPAPIWSRPRPWSAGSPAAWRPSSCSSSGWAHEIAAPRDALREVVTVSIAGATDAQLDRDPLARATRMPKQVYDAVSAGLERGPVLVQTPRRRVRRVPGVRALPDARPMRGVHRPAGRGRPGRARPPVAGAARSSRPGPVPSAVTAGSGHPSWGSGAPPRSSAGPSPRSRWSPRAATAWSPR